MLLGATVSPLSYPVFWSVFRWCRYGPCVLFGVCACYVRRRLDTPVCCHLVWSWISRDAWKDPVCPLSNHTGEPWSPIVDPAIAQCPPGGLSPAFIHVLLVALEPSTAAILLCRMSLFVVDQSDLDVMRCLTVPPLIP